MNVICGEIAWRKALRGWRVKAFHYPKELNTAADALSRLTGPNPKQRPDAVLKSANLRFPPPQSGKLWLTRFDRL